jgi:hypothetical protein
MNKNTPKQSTHKRHYKTNQRGYAGILLALTIIFIAALLIGMSNQTKNFYSYKEVLPQTKLYLTNTELSLNQMAQDWNIIGSGDFYLWVDSNAKTLSQKQLPFITCNPDLNKMRILDTNTVQFNIVCSGAITREDDALSIQLTKTITVKKH